jgi:hypothetical protein
LLLLCQLRLARLGHGDAARDATLSIEGGSLDEPIDVSAATHIWTTRKLQGVIIPENAEQHAREPTMG